MPLEEAYAKLKNLGAAARLLRAATRLQELTARRRGKHTLRIS